MKKFLIAGLIAFSVVSVTTIPAQAGNPWPVIGGIAGGLLLGEVLSHHHNHGTRPGYYYEEDTYYDSCWIEYRKVWDPYLHRYVTQKVRFCD